MDRRMAACLFVAFLIAVMVLAASPSVAEPWRFEPWRATLIVRMPGGQAFAAERPEPFATLSSCMARVAEVAERVMGLGAESVWGVCSVEGSAA